MFRRQVIHSTLAAWLLISSVAPWASAQPIINSDVLTATAEGGKLQFLPLSPIVIKSENGSPIINVFVKQGSFSQFTITLSPTVSWKLSAAQEQSLKKTGAKSYAPWPGTQASLYLYYGTSDGDKKLISSGRATPVVVGANSVLEVTSEPLELNDARDLLFGKSPMSILFTYDIPTPVRVDQEAKAEWVQSLQNDIRTYRKLPVAGAVNTIFAALRQKYLEQFGVSPEQMVQMVGRIVRGSPLILEQFGGQIQLVHDLSATIQIDIVREKRAAVYLQDLYQGRLELGNLCTTLPATIFVTTDSGTSVGCGALKDK